MEADIICSVLVMRCLSERNTCFLSLANVYLAVCGLTWTLQPAFSPVRFRLLSMFHTSPTGNRDSSKNMIERTAVALFFCLFHFLWFPYINPSVRLSQNETAFFCVCKKIGQVLTSLSQNLPVSLIFCILGNQVKISQR